MAIAIDASTPAATSQTNGATTTLVSSSFSPPAGSVVVISWQSNSDVSPPASAPTISNTGGLTFSLIGWRSEADLGGSPPGRDGHCAMWYAPVSSAPGSMTCTVTNTATSGSRHARLKPVVLTGVDTASPIASSGEGSDNAGGLSFSYTSAVADSLGFASVSDWDTASSTFTATAGTTIVDSAQVASSVNCATLRQTTATTAGATVTLGLSSPTSTTWNYVWAEFRPGASATNASATTATMSGVATSQDARGLPGRPLHTGLIDNFNDGVVDTSIWTANYGSPTETGGRARIPCTTSYAAYCTSDVWRLAESSVYARLYPPANGGATAEAWIQLLVLTPVAGTDCGAEVNAGVTPTVLNLYSRVGYSDASMVTLTYDSTAHAWVRIRETAGTLYWDTSADGVSWTNRRSLTAPTWVDDGNLQIQLISHRGNGTADYAEVDNVNVNPSITNVAAETAAATTAAADPAGSVRAAGTAVATVIETAASVTATANATAAAATTVAAAEQPAVGLRAASVAAATVAGQNPTSSVTTAAQAPTATHVDTAGAVAAKVYSTQAVATASVVGVDATTTSQATSADVTPATAGVSMVGVDPAGQAAATAGGASAAAVGGDLAGSTSPTAATATTAVAGTDPGSSLAAPAGAASVTAAGQDPAGRAATGTETASAGVAAPFDPAGGSTSAELTADNPIDWTMAAISPVVSMAMQVYADPATATAAVVVAASAAGAVPAESVALVAAGGDLSAAVTIDLPFAGVADSDVSPVDPATGVGPDNGSTTTIGGLDATPTTVTSASAGTAGAAFADTDATAIGGSFVNADPVTAGATAVGADPGSSVTAPAATATGAVGAVDASVSTLTVTTASAATATTSWVGADPVGVGTVPVPAGTAAVGLVGQDASAGAASTTTATAETAGATVDADDQAAAVAVVAAAVAIVVAAGNATIPVTDDVEPVASGLVASVTGPTLSASVSGRELVGTVVGDGLVATVI